MDIHQYLFHMTFMINGTHHLPKIHHIFRIKDSCGYHFCRQHRSSCGKSTNHVSKRKIQDPALTWEGGLRARGGTLRPEFFLPDGELQLRKWKMQIQVKDISGPSIPTQTQKITLLYIVQTSLWYSQSSGIVAVPRYTPKKKVVVLIVKLKAW